MNLSGASAPAPFDRHASSQRLQNRVAIITGASSGLGRAIALAYAAEGAKVVCADLDPIAKIHINQDDTKATHDVIKERGGTSSFIKCDVGESNSVEKLIEQAVLEYGRLDIMVNNAGIDSNNNKLKLVHETDEDSFDRTMRINCKGVFLGCKFAGKQMIKQDPRLSGDRGWIINMASVAGLVGLPGAVSYTTSKGAVVQMTKAVALDYAPYRIHCNALCPGFTKTALIQKITNDPTLAARVSAGIPFRGLGEPEDVAKAAVFLASDDASWVTGHPLVIDGGYIAQ